MRTRYGASPFAADLLKGMHRRCEWADIIANRCRSYGSHYRLLSVLCEDVNDFRHIATFSEADEKVCQTDEDAGRVLNDES